MDPYQTLGVLRRATQSDIRNAYDKLVRQYQPLANRGDAAAQKRMKEINAAYGKLDTPARREAYDRNGTADRPQPPEPGASAGGRGGSARGQSPAASLLNDMHRQAASNQASGPAGAIKRVELTVDELVRGRARRVIKVDGREITLEIVIPSLDLDE